ncbi:ABC-2 type transporter [Parasponia andersonii]|uniref:ABC-2 type transporter n=1 Tax=Parasponia andersonii TaxID=3476 RepID=A0A2P5B215_PARAD|nr:ABC-2 type transporter [Parasponia andersonii]
MFLAVVFLGGNNANAVQPIVAIERTVFYRERAAGMYSALPYAFAQVAIETIYTAIQSLLYTIILFTVFGFEWKTGKFLWFYYYVTMFFTYFTMCGMMVLALTPGIEVAAIVMSFILSFWNLFAGFFISRMQIPIWWRWYYWGSPMAWTLYGLVTSQLGDKDANLEVPGVGTGVPLKMFLKESLGFDYDFLPAVAFAHLGWVLLFLFVFSYGIKFLNFQKR